MYLPKCSGYSLQELVTLIFPAIQLASSKFDMKLDSDCFFLIFMEMVHINNCRPKERD